MVGQATRHASSNNLTVLSSITGVIGDSDRERELDFQLAVFVHPVGCHVRAVRVQFVLEALTLVLDRNDSCSDLPCLADDLFVVEPAISQQEVDLEGVGGDAVERVLDRVGLLFVAADVCHGECDRLAVGDDVGSTVAVIPRRVPSKWDSRP